MSRAGRGNRVSRVGAWSARHPLPGRSGFLPILLIALSGFQAGCRTKVEPGVPIDSVVLITIDTLRADHVSCYGASPVATPSLDALAKRGALVRRAWATVPLTTASHASILTGLYPPSHGVRDNAGYQLPMGVPTLAEHLAAPGRASAAFVASYTTSRRFGLDRGFATFADDFGHAPDGSPLQQRTADKVVDLASAWLAEHRRGPFFVWVHLFDPHTPYEPPAPYRQSHPGNPYGGEVAFADAQVGRLLALLEGPETSGRTAVLVLADHGEGLGDHGEADHGSLLYETTLRIPFLIHAPGRIAPGTEIPGPASTVDVVPTVLDLLGLPTPGGLDGRSLVGSSNDGERDLFAETLYGRTEFGWSPMYAYRHGDMKLIESPQPELFDLAADPAERNDLAPSRPGDAAALTAGISAMKGALGRKGGAARKEAHSPAIDPEEAEKLESLGYAGGGVGDTLGTSADPFPPVGGRNPRDAIGDLRDLERAQLLLLDGKSADAVPILKALAERDPANPQVSLKLAKALTGADRQAEAERVYSALLEKSPSFYLALRSYSDFLEARGRAAEALALWRRAPASLSGYVGLEVAVARVETSAGLPAEAARRLESYLHARPREVEAWAELGRARAALGEKPRALEAFREALALRPSDGAALAGALNILVSSGRRDEAVALVQDLLKRAPEDPLLREIAARLAGQAPSPPRRATSSR